MYFKATLLFISIGVAFASYPYFWPLSSCMERLKVLLTGLITCCLSSFSHCKDRWLALVDLFVSSLSSNFCPSCSETFPISRAVIPFGGIGPVADGNNIVPSCWDGVNILHNWLKFADTDILIICSCSMERIKW